ncbi:hypothetical protein [Stutzerimonas kunmingensis]|uniref:hypothetical protein n=1 Tax=Stutzerimonas kunmingensis TaxID=1211807 RepID=UPI0028A96609|nr:hypothetical protein [Stutzerimonas kunmingensis]
MQVAFHDAVLNVTLSSEMLIFEGAQPIWPEESEAFSACIAQPESETNEANETKIAIKRMGEILQVRCEVL